ncbi:MAG: glycosyl hydrolase family 28-related protein [Candidatus Velthaea sp.]
MTTNSYAFGVENPAIDEYLQKPYPAYQLSGTELNGGFAEVVEVGGQMWQVTNAVYNASVGGFVQVNPGSSSSAFVLTPGAAPQYGIAPANASTPIVWSLSTIAPSPGIFVNVANYGAIGDGATDDTSAITRAIAACGIGSTLFFPHTAANVYIVNPNASTSTGYGEYWALTVPQSSLKIQGESNVVTIRLKPNGFIPNAPATNICCLFGFTGVTQPGQIEFADITLDGNSSNQTFGTTYSTSSLRAFIAPNHYSVIADTYLVCDNVRFTNFSLPYPSGGLNQQGIGICTFGWSNTISTRCLFEYCDTGIWYTSPSSAANPASIPTGLIVSDFTMHNCENRGIYLEGVPNAVIQGGHIYSDDLTNAHSGDGIGVYTGPLQNLTGILISNVRFYNLQYPMRSFQNTTNIVRDSAYTNVAAFNCLGSFNWAFCDSSAPISNFTSDNCGNGPTKWGAGTPKGAVEISSSSVDMTILEGGTITNAQNNAIVVSGSFLWKNGKVVGTKTGFANYGYSGFTLAVPATNSLFKNVTGITDMQIYPVVPAFPLSTVATQNVYPFDLLLSISGGTVTVISTGPLTADGAAHPAMYPTGLTNGLFLIPAHTWFAITYSVAPTLTYFQV